MWRFAGHEDKEGLDLINKEAVEKKEVTKPEEKEPDKPVLQELRISVLEAGP